MSFNAGSKLATSNKANNRFDISHCSINSLLEGSSVEKSHDRILVKIRTMWRDKYNVGEAWAVTVDPIPKFPTAVAFARTSWSNPVTHSSHSLNLRYAVNLFCFAEDIREGLDAANSGCSEPPCPIDDQLHLRQIPPTTIPPYLTIAPVS